MPGSLRVAEQFANNLAQKGQRNPGAEPKYLFLSSLAFLAAELDVLLLLKDKLPEQG